MSRFVRLYIEGGATGKTADNDFRRGWKKFLSELHELARKHGYQSLVIVRGKGRGNAFKQFVSHRKQYPDDLCALLVDSETSVGADQHVWEVVSQREGDGWTKPAWAGSGHLYLMVQFVETWLLTDQEALKTFFKKGFRVEKLPTTGLEQRTKDEIERALHAATKDCGKGSYRHGQAHEIMEFVSPVKVQKLAHCQRLFAGLTKMISGRERE